jgi:hypothetical protein
MRSLKAYAGQMLVLTIVLFGVTDVFGVSGRPYLTMNAEHYCAGESWTLQLEMAYPHENDRLVGTSNGVRWEVLWSEVTPKGIFTLGAIGTHTLQLDTFYWGLSNLVSFDVADCGGVWRNTGSMNTARTYHTATLLANRKVLVTGSWQYPVGGSDSAELYDGATGAWSVTGSLTTPRAAYTSTLLRNGKVLVVGGYAGSPLSPTLLSSAELYDPQAETWSLTGSLHAARVGHTATLLPDGKVLVAAGDVAGEGFDGLPSSELYDPGTGTWRVVGSLPYRGHLYQTATLLSTGKVLLVGGIDNREAPPTQGGAALYDPSTEKWTTTPATAIPREGHTATLLPNGKVLVAGGAQPPTFAEVYDPETEIWSPTEPSIAAYTATLLPNGKVFFAGGGVFDPGTGSWSEGPSPKMPRRGDGHTATLLSSGRLLLAGGGSPGAEIYDGGFDIPLLKLNSSIYCVGASWELTVSQAAPAASVRLVGVSNGSPWEIARWNTIASDGRMRASGTFTEGTEGTHTLHVEIAGVWSQDVTFRVLNCQP